jgi:ABC-type Fe3+-hydroxamate transport system substrate-binding protein
MKNAKLIAILLNRFDVKATVIDTLKHDMDFIENVEMFREDTIALGYENEAQRVGDEFAKKYTEVNEKMIDDLLTCHVGGSQFIVGNTTFTEDYTYELTDIDEKRVFLSVAYIS